MNAITCPAYGSPDILRLSTVDLPVPERDEVLIRIHAAPVTTTDCTARSGRPYYSRLAFGLRRPKHPILGTELAGVVEAVGRDVTRFQPGDEVIAASGDSFGAHAEYITLPEDAAIGPKPASLSFTDAVAISEGALTALPFLRDGGEVRPGQTVLVNGASGAVGTAAVQLARQMGASVTGVCGPAKAEIVRSLGADRVIDYTTTDFTATGEKWDVIFDAAGKSTFGRSRDALQSGGTYLTTVPSFAIFPQMAWTAKVGNRRAVIMFTGLRKPADRARDLEHIATLAESGDLRPVIDSCFAMRAIAEAHRRVDTGHKTGTVVVSIR